MYFQCHIKCSKCSPLACMHAFWRFVNSLTALLLLLLVTRYILRQPCVRLLIQWHQRGDKFVAQYFISIVCAGIRTNYCLCFESLLSIVCICILSTCDTFPIVTALTKCSLLSNISKIKSCLFTSSSARLIDVPVKPVLLSTFCYN